MQILVVDDEPLFLRLLSAQLKDLGYCDVNTAGSGREALARLKSPRARYDLIMLDIRMPEMDGVTLCRHIRTLPAYRETPIVMVTAMSDKSFIDDAFAAGALDYITKPLDRVELKARLGMVARLRMQEKAAAAASASLSSYAIAPPFAFDDPITLPNVDRLLSPTALENYLLTLGLGRMHGLRACAVAIENADQIFMTKTPGNFVDMIGDVATIVQDCLKTEDAMISYTGGGIFSCVLRGENGYDAELMTATANFSMSDFEPIYSDANMSLPVIRFGTLARMPSLAIGRPTRLLQLAKMQIYPAESHSPLKDRLKRRLIGSL
ncbi:PleD family two-component system response regulator [Thioclava sp. 15-R06ZXC-3]|uniref:PleD family two-component system response regulator n=1 Tax=Thioclava arctica TaxID=3238301 RepID=A0ABV3TRB3_9RHOB